MLLDHLAKAERHVAIGERILAREQARLEERRRQGRDVSETERLLQSLEDMQQMHIEHRDQIRREIEKS